MIAPTSKTPRVHLPSQRDLNPNLCILIGIVEKWIADQGPASAATMCARLSIDLRRAAMHEQVVGVIAGPLLIGPGCLIDAADWFASASLCCWRARQ